MEKLIIDEEIKSLIPPLTDDEFKQLEENCVNGGIRDALIVWKCPDGQNILIDGHNRYRIAEENALEYRTEEKEFKDRTDAKLWIIDNQLGRRNLIPYDRVLLEDKKREFLAGEARERIGGDKKSDDYISLQRNLGNDNTNRRERTTDYKIAQAAGVSEDTVRKVRNIESYGTPEIKQQIRNKELSINKANQQVEKVKAIENSGNEFLKKNVREGKTTIDDAYRVVTGTQNKSPSQAKKEFLNEIKQERKDFQEKKEDGIVSISEIKNDDKNRKILASDLYTKMLRMGDGIDHFTFDIDVEHIDIHEYASEWSTDKINNLVYYIDKWIQKLIRMKGLLKNEK